MSPVLVGPAREEAAGPAGAAFVTGGAGFVATNLADRLVRSGRRVIVLDNLSRAGAARNLEWLRATHGAAVTVHVGDVRDADTVGRLAAAASVVYHCAAQTAVTASLRDPLLDFDVNARGTLTLLEAVRACRHPPAVLFTSTNKVYGTLGDLPLRDTPQRCEPIGVALRRYGVGEERGLAFHSPYGCSKGVAEQYVLDYARTFGLRTVVFRMSCVYGPHQRGTEDQGWVAHFARATLRGSPITIYGDGRQVRDVLHVADLVEALLLAEARVDTLSGRVFNIGGGPGQTVSLLELIDRLDRMTGRRPQVRLLPSRAADQRYYVSDVRRFAATTGWRPRIGVHEGVSDLLDWLAADGRAEPVGARRMVR